MLLIDIFFEGDKGFMAGNSHKCNSSTFLLIEKLPKDQADMNPARSVRPLTAAANGNKNAACSKWEKARKACIFVNASAFARRCWRPAIHTASAPHVGLPTRVLYGQVPRQLILRYFLTLFSSLICHHVYNSRNILSPPNGAPPPGWQSDVPHLEVPPEDMFPQQAVASADATPPYCHSSSGTDDPLHHKAADGRK